MDDATFNRGFLDVTKFAQPGYNKPDTLIGSAYQERQPIKGSFPGYQWVGGIPRPVDLVPNTQNYAKYLTPWEMLHSSLSSPFRVRLRPVIGTIPRANDEAMLSAMREYYPLIAHYGQAPAEKIIVPGKYAGSHGWDAGKLSELVANDVPAFVHMDDPEGGWGPLERGGVFSHTVLTDIEGRILRVFKSRARDDSIVPVDPSDYYVVGQLVVGLGKALGRKVVDALARRAARREAEAVVRTLAEEMAQWGRLEAYEVSLNGLTRVELNSIKETMQRTMSAVLNGGATTIRATGIRANWITLLGTRDSNSSWPRSSALKEAISCSIATEE